MTKPKIGTNLDAIAREVRSLHDQDEALSKARVKTKVEQREVRLKIGALVADLTDVQIASVAERSGYTSARLGNFAFVYRQWPAGTFPEDVSYTPLEELARHPDRFSLIASGMSKRDARAARGGKVDTPSRWSPEVKAKFIADALADPEVASQVANNQSARAAMAEAEWQHRENRRAEHAPGMRRQRQLTEAQELVRQVDNLRYGVGRAVERAIELDAAGNADLIEVVDELKNAVGWLDSYANGGSTTFESDLENLLKGN